MPDEDGALAVEDGSGGVVGLGVVAVGLGVVAVGLGVVGVGTVPNLGKESNERYLMHYQIEKRDKDKKYAYITQCYISKYMPKKYKF